MLLSTYADGRSSLYEHSFCQIIFIKTLKLAERLLSVGFVLASVLSVTLTSGIDRSFRLFVAVMVHKALCLSEHEYALSFSITFQGALHSIY
jgi:hypothetical protein